MKEYPVSFLVRLTPKHKNIIQRIARSAKQSEAWVIREAIISLDEFSSKL